jgi:transposase
MVAQRARIVLLAREGRGTEEIACMVGLTARAVRKWNARFAGAPSLEAVEKADRSGRPSRVPLAVRCQLVRLAYERPNHEIMRFRDVCTYASLADGWTAETGYRLSTSEIGPILRFKEISPHHIKQWLHSEDLDFLPKAEPVCDLYQNPPPGAAVVRVDEPDEGARTTAPDSRQRRGRKQSGTSVHGPSEGRVEGFIKHRNRCEPIRFAGHGAPRRRYVRLDLQPVHYPERTSDPEH